MVPGNRRTRGLYPVGNGTATTIVGMSLTAVGTATLRTTATTNALTRMSRIAYVSGTADLSSCGIRNNVLTLSPYPLTAPPAVGRGLIVARFSWGLSTTTAGLNWFIGLRNPATAIPANNPSTLTDMIGFAMDPGQTTVRFMHNDGSGTATSVDLGTNFPGKDTTVAYMASISLDMTPTGPVWTGTIQRVGTRFGARLRTNLDCPTTGITTFHVHANNGLSAGGVAAAIDLGYFEIETPQ